MRPVHPSFSQRVSVLLTPRMMSTYRLVQKAARLFTYAWSAAWVNISATRCHIIKQCVGAYVSKGRFRVVNVERGQPVTFTRRRFLAGASAFALLVMAPKCKPATCPTRLRAGNTFYTVYDVRNCTILGVA
jgi:hypothetical protein